MSVFFYVSVLLPVFVENVKTSPSNIYLFTWFSWDVSSSPMNFILFFLKKRKMNLQWTCPVVPPSPSWPFGLVLLSSPHRMSGRAQLHLPASASHCLPVTSLNYSQRHISRRHLSNDYHYRAGIKAARSASRVFGRLKQTEEVWGNRFKVLAWASLHLCGEHC